VDAILSAVPALRRLQSALIPSPSAAVTEPTVELSKVIPWSEKPLLARQMQSEHMLEALTERTEVESECESDRNVPTPPRRPRRRESGFIRLPTFSPELEVVDTGRERIRDEEGEVESIVMDTVQEESESELTAFLTNDRPKGRTSIITPAGSEGPRPWPLAAALREGEYNHGNEICSDDIPGATHSRQALAISVSLHCLQRTSCHGTSKAGATQFTRRGQVKAGVYN
jgi:hypothetical protein